MENAQFERLLHEITESRQHTDDVAATLRDEMRRSTAETIAMLGERIESSAEESRRHFGVVADAIRGDVRLLAESVATLDARRGQQIEELRRDMTTESAETRAMIKLSYVELDRRLTTLEAARAQ